MSRFPYPLDSRLVATLAAVILAAPALAQDAPGEPSSPPNASQPLPLWEIGLFAIGSYQTPYPGSDQQMAKARLLPYALYRGPVLRIADGGIGLRAYTTPRYEWSVSATGAFGGASDEVRAREGMPAIGTLVEFGPALKINLGDMLDARRDPRATSLELPIRAVFDVSDDFSHQGWTFEPRLSHAAWRNDTFTLSFTASLLVGDRAVNHMFYGVDDAYAVPGRPAYAAKAGLIATRVGVGLGQRISNSVRLHWFAQLESVRGAANEGSPLVRAHEDGGLGVSVTWGVWQSQKAGVE